MMKLLKKILCFLPLALMLSHNLQAEVTYYHNDLQGSAVAATDEQGNVKWREVYKPFGDKLLNEPASGANKQGYTGKYHDDEIGLTYLNARMYDPVVSRFMGIDPVGFTSVNAMSFNRYIYVNNNPYKYNDTEGEFLNFVAGGVGALIGGAIEFGIQAHANHKSGKKFRDYSFNKSRIAKSAALGGVIGLTGGTAAGLAAKANTLRGVSGTSAVTKELLAGAAGSAIGNQVASPALDFAFDGPDGIRTLEEYTIESVAAGVGFIAGGALDELLSPLSNKLSQKAVDSSLGQISTAFSSGAVKGAKQYVTNAGDYAANDKAKQVLDSE